MGDTTTCQANGRYNPQYSYGAFGGYGVAVNHGSETDAKAKAEDCADQLSREQQSPYRAKKGAGSGSHPYENLGYFTVEAFPACEAGAIFDSWFSSANKSDARDCADALSTISGGETSYGSVRIPGIFADSWRVVETSECAE